MSERAEFFATLATLGDPDWIRDRERDRRFADRESFLYGTVNGKPVGPFRADDEPTLGDRIAAHRERVAYEDDVADGLISEPDQEEEGA